MKSGYLGRSLEITSLPAFPDWEGSEVFWGGLLQVCRQHRISDLLAHTYASAAVTIPALPGEIRRRIRCEYVLEVQRLDLWDQLSPNHERNIKRARKAGLQMRRVVDRYACQEHARLIGMSLERRKSRGESVLVDIQVQSFVAMTQSGADELNPGLARFKAGFGASLVKLEAAEFFLGSTIRQRLRSAAWLLRDHSLLIVGRSSSG